MATIDSTYIGSKISFDLWPSAIIGTTFKSAEVKAILDFDTVSTFKDVRALHSQVYSTLPNGTDANPEKVNYIKFLLSNGKVEYIADSWIKSSTVQTETTKDFQIVLSSVSPIDRERFKQILVASGATIKSSTIL